MGAALVDEKLIELLQRMQQDHSFRKVAKKAGIGSGETLARVWRREGRLGGESARKLAVAYGDEYEVTEDMLRVWNRLPPRNGGPVTPLPKSPVPAFPAPTYYTMALPIDPARSGRGLEPSPWVVMQNVNFIVQRIHAGQPQPYTDDPPTLPVNVPHPGRYLAMRVVGDCMTPDIEPGDIVILDQDMAIRPDWVAAIELDGETRLTRMVRRDPDEWEFARDDPAYPPLVVPANGVTIIGVVIARQKGPPVRRSPRRPT